MRAIKMLKSSSDFCASASDKKKKKKKENVGNQRFEWWKLDIYALKLTPSEK